MPRSGDRGDGHPSQAAGCPATHAADPRAGQRASPPANRVAPSYLALLRVEFAAFHSGRRLAPPPGIVTVALVLASRRTGVTRYPALRSSDFPRALHGVAPDVARGHPTASLTARFYLRPTVPSIVFRTGVQAQPRTTTSGGPPAATRSIASLASASASAFWARGTWAAVHRANPARDPRACALSGISLASLTRQRPASCSTMSFESSSRWTSRAPSSAASARARTTPVYSATLLVWTPRYSEMVASGTARGSRASGRDASSRTAPRDAGPGLPRAAPSVRMT